MATAISKSTGIPVIVVMDCFSLGAEGSAVMKNLKRLAFGVLSSLLFTVGFVRAAEMLDPMSQSVPVNSDAAISSTPDCGSLCDIHDDKA
jgi:hypothetical protein